MVSFETRSHASFPSCTVISTVGKQVNHELPTSGKYIYKYGVLGHQIYHMNKIKFSYFTTSCTLSTKNVSNGFWKGVSILCSLHFGFIHVSSLNDMVVQGKFKKSTSKHYNDRLDSVFGLNVFINFVFNRNEPDNLSVIVQDMSNSDQLEQFF
uniref:Uncharacterized protein n=1 Tax=Glossina pallidipes TaxID=7398 RepID=A0A1B0A188_GLOPL